MTGWGHNSWGPDSWGHDRLGSECLTMLGMTGWGIWHSRVGDGRGVYKQALGNCCLFQ